MGNIIKLTENELHRIIMETVNEIMAEDIHIKKKNRGKFTATQKRTHKTPTQLKHSKNPKTRQRANFAIMAKRHWKPLPKD